MKKLLTTLLMQSLLLGATAAYAEGTIQPFAPESFNRIKASHAGKPFVVMVWSLDCAYCQASLHILAEIQRKRGIDIVTISTDRADDESNSQLIRKKLTSSGIKGEMWAFGAAPAEKLRYAIDPKWRGEIPRTYWFDQEGKVAAYSGTVTADTATKLLTK